MLNAKIPSGNAFSEAVSDFRRPKCNAWRTSCQELSDAA